MLLFSIIPTLQQLWRQDKYYHCSVYEKKSLITHYSREIKERNLALLSVLRLRVIWVY